MLCESSWGRITHPNVVRVYAWVTVHDHHCLVMQYVSGGSLGNLLQSVGPIEWQRSARYIADVGRTYFATGTFAGFRPQLIFRADRFGRGGDHTSFNKEDELIT